MRVREVRGPPPPPLSVHSLSNLPPTRIPRTSPAILSIQPLTHLADIELADEVLNDAILATLRVDIAPKPAAQPSSHDMG